MLTPVTENRLNGYGASQQLDAHDLSGGFRDNHGRQMLYDTGKPKRYLAKDVIYRESDQVDRIYMIRSGLVKLLSYLPTVARCETRYTFIKPGCLV